MATHIIINPHSGSGGQRGRLTEFVSLLRRRGRQVVEYVTTAAGDATRYAASLGGDTDAVVAWGGDGTVREIAAALAGSGVPILPCPLGTENLLARELNIPSYPHRLVEILDAGLTRELDVGIVNGQTFLLIVGIGFDGEVVRRLASVRRGHITHLSYFWPIWRTFWEHNFPRIRVLVEGREIYNDFGMAFVGNVSRYAVGLRICHNAVFDDGLLDLVVFSCDRQSGLMLHAAWTLLRRHPLKGNVLYRQVRQLRIESDRPAPSQIDGDIGPNLPVDISVLPGKLKVLVPPRDMTGLWPWTLE